MKALTLAAVAAFLAAACSNQTAQTSEAPDYAAIAAGAVAAEGRWADDLADDARRKPATALEFFQVAPGMSVFEIEAGGGYYTELLSHAVGSDGEVVMQNHAGILDFVGDKIEARLADNRLSNVRQSISIYDSFDAEDASVDLATWVQGPHELYFTPSDGTFLGDPAGSYAEVFRILKPGGAYVVVDHSAVDGAPETTGNDLHRIDKSIVIAMAESAGFVLEAESDFLGNPDDDRTTSVFDPSIRGYTDQFALRFRKPE